MGKGSFLFASSISPSMTSVLSLTPSSWSLFCLYAFSVSNWEESSAISPPAKPNGIRLYKSLRLSSASLNTVSSSVFRSFNLTNSSSDIMSPSLINFD